MADITVSLPDGSTRTLPSGATAADLAADIGERSNLAKKKPKLAGTLRGQLDAWLVETGARRPTLRK